MPFLKLDEVDKREFLPGSTVRSLHSANMTFCHWHFKTGALLPEHAHPHEQVTHIIEGKFELTVAGETQVLGPGSVAIVPSNAAHSGKAVTDCYCLDVFYPVREDYREGGSAEYLLRRRKSKEQ